MESKIVILGLGNLVLSDDAFGPLAVRYLAEKLDNGSGSISYKENYSGGIDLLDDITGFNKLILIDSIITGIEAPGTLFEAGMDDLDKLGVGRLVSSHGLNLPTVIEFGKKCGYEMPDEVRIFAVEAEDTESFCEDLCPAVEESLPELLSDVKKIISKWR